MPTPSYFLQALCVCFRAAKSANRIGPACLLHGALQARSHGRSIGRPGREQATLATQQQTFPDQITRVTVHSEADLFTGDFWWSSYCDQSSSSYWHNIPTLHVNRNADQQLKTFIYFSKTNLLYLCNNSSFEHTGSLIQTTDLKRKKIHKWILNFNPSVDSCDWWVAAVKDVKRKTSSSRSEPSGQRRLGLFYLFGRPVPVVFLPPQLGLHLQPDVLKVNVSVHRLHVALGHIVAGRLPVAAVWEVRQLFPGGEKQEVVSSLVVFTFFLITHNHNKKKWCGETM